MIDELNYYVPSLSAFLDGELHRFSKRWTLRQNIAILRDLVRDHATIYLHDNRVSPEHAERYLHEVLA